MQMKRFNSESYNAVATFLLFNVSLSHFRHCSVKLSSLFSIYIVFLI